MNEVTTKTFTVREALLGIVSNKVNALNRRAKRLDVAPIEMTVSDSRVELWKRDDDEVAVTLVDVTITLNIPKLADWSFLATIQHLGEGQNLLLCVPRPDGAPAIDLSEYRTCAPVCQHCNQVRVRKDTYVVQHDDGTRKQVGKDCLANFTGYGKTAEQAAQQAEWLSKCLDFLASPGGETEDDDREGGYGGSSREGVGLDRFLSFVVAVSRVTGFRTRKQAEPLGQSSTKEDALFHMEPPRGVKLDKLVTPTDDDRSYAKRAREWAAGLEAKSDFDYNLKTVASNDGVLYRNLGIAAYIVEAFNRHLGKVAERANRPASHHFGEVKQRLRNLKLTYKGCSSFDSQFGITFYHRFSTENGSDVIWKTGTCAPCEPGETVIVDATVKQHDEYNGRPQTVLTRLTVVEGVPADA